MNRRRRSFLVKWRGKPDEEIGKRIDELLDRAEYEREKYNMDILYSELDVLASLIRWRKQI